VRGVARYPAMSEEEGEEDEEEQDGAKEARDTAGEARRRAKDEEEKRKTRGEHVPDRAEAELRCPSARATGWPAAGKARWSAGGEGISRWKPRPSE